jgi:hypothetical protein
MESYCVLKAGKQWISVFRPTVEPELFHTN